MLKCLKIQFLYHRKMYKLFKHQLNVSMAHFSSYLCFLGGFKSYYFIEGTLRPKMKHASGPVGFDSAILSRVNGVSTQEALQLCFSVICLTHLMEKTFDFMLSGLFSIILHTYLQ